MNVFSSIPVDDRSAKKRPSYSEFAGTLLGFDDYVSMSLSSLPLHTSTLKLTRRSDMVLEDVTELYINLAHAGDLISELILRAVTTAGQIRSFPRPCSMAITSAW